MAVCYTLGILFSYSCILALSRIEFLKYKRSVQVLQDDLQNFLLSWSNICSKILQDILHGYAQLAILNLPDPYFKKYYSNS